MLYLVNGMDVVKSPDLMGGKEYKGHIKNKGISLVMLLLALMFYNTHKWMDAVNSTSPKDASPCQGNGCSEL